MKLKQIAFIGAAIVAGTLIGRFILPSSGNSASDHSHEAEAAESPSTWTCSMHPQIQQPDAGDCPICGMDLIPLEDDAGADDGPRVMSMSESSRALADIQTVSVVQDYPEAEIRLTGKLGYDETREKSLTARFPARIDELYVNFTGIRVKQGEHLAKVYSPELLTAQRELLTAYRVDPDSSITRAAREKLRLWDLLPEQIESIIESGEAKDHFVLKAPVGGIVADKKIKEGDYVKTGEPLFRIVDLDVLWATLDAYESDLAWLRFGQEVSFTVQSFPGESFEGKIAFIEPEVDRKTRTTPVRVNVSNTDEKLKPGMFVRAVVASRLADDGKVYAPEFAGKWISPMHPEVIKDEPGDCDVCGMALVPAKELGYVNDQEKAAPLIVPASAVLRTGKRGVVYVEKPDAERPTYEGREITLGPRAGDFFIIKAGLDADERVVINGAFKIDSALQIQAKPSMMNPDNGESTNAHEAHQAKTFEIPTELATQLVQPYLALQASLAGDQFEAAKAALKSIMEVSGHHGDLPDLIHKMLAADSLDDIRRPHFEMLSNVLIESIQSKPSAFPQELLVMHCPMVYDDRGADWLQASEPLLNPYFGAMMLKCGETKAKVAEMEGTEVKEQDAGISVVTAKLILADYLKLQSALASDELDGSKSALKQMMESTGHHGALPDLIHSMLAAKELDGIRRPHFETLSNWMIEAVESDPSAFDQDLYRMNCSMVYPDRGADWIQADDKLLNPYWGSQMLRCGSVKGKFE
ncbi:MAG: efflux RND transporter periplasmic adaptor subunit [Coraliomargarita sp.]